MMKPWKLRASQYALLMLAMPLAHATDGMPWEKGSLQIGGFITSSDTEMRIDSETLGAGAVVDVENLLGVDADSLTYRIDGLYRLGESRRHELSLHYFSSNRSGDKIIDRDIQVGDTTFPVNAHVETDFKLQFINFDYSYAFLQDDRVRMSVSAGLHTTGIGLELDEVGGANKLEESEFTAPLPVIGLHGEVLLAPRWMLKGGIDAFYLEYDNVTGSLTDLNLAVEYLPFKNVGFGVALNSIRMQVEADSDNDAGVDLNGEVKFNFTGLLLYAKMFY